MATMGTNLTRRDFLKIGASTTFVGAAALAAQYSLQTGSLVEKAAKPLQQAQFDEKIVKTTCTLCTSGCGLDVRVVNGRAVKVEGNPLHPLNQGVCCLRGQASLEVLYSPERIQHPRMQMGARGSGDWKEISWDEALAVVAEKLDSLRSAGQAHQVALVHGELRGQMRSLIQRFMQVYGSPNVISRESLGEAATRQAMFLLQGINGLPVYDLNNANYALCFGGNLLEASRNVIAALGSVAFMRRGRPQRGKLVVAHPRLSITSVKADEWIPLRPGTYAALALGMANVIINSQLYDEDFVRDYTYGFEDFEDENGTLHQGFKSLVLDQYPIDRVAQITGIAAETVARLAGEFATNRPAVAILPTEAGELTSGNGLYTALAVHALNALVGSIDCQGGVLVQRFPQPAAWPEYTPDASAQAGLAYERLDGAGSAEYPLAISIYQNLAERILSEQPYPLQALFLCGANPVYDIPDQGRCAQALLHVPFVVSFSSVLDESAAHADLILPASTFLEVWGDDYIEGGGYAGVSLRQPVVESLYDTRDPGDVLLTLAAHLGGSLAEALPWKTYQELVQARLSNVNLDWQKFLENGCWSEMVYFNAAPGSSAWNQVVGRDRLNAPQDGRFDFFSRELFSLFSPMLAAQDLDLACLPHFEIPSALDSNSPELLDFPLLLISQPLITHTSAWQGILPTLQECVGLQDHARWESWVEINPQAASALGLKDGDLAWVESPTGREQALVRLNAGIWPNVVFMPAGQGHHSSVEWGRRSPTSLTVGSNPNQLGATATEPLSGLALTGPVRVKVYKA